MKKIYSIILFAVALFAIQPVIKAEDPPYTEKNNIAYSKYVTGPEEGIYTIHLDTFVTGEKTITESSIPADIILVLDVSGSMTGNDSYIDVVKYTARPSQGYTYNNYPSSSSYYIKYTDGQYYQVSRGRTYGWPRNYYLSFSVPGQGTYYLDGTGIVGTRPSTVTSNSTTIWTGVLYTRTSQTMTKLAALKDAVSDFIDEVQKNNDFMADKVTPRTTKLGNQIAIVKYANNEYYGTAGMSDTQKEESLAEGNHRGAGNNNNYNYTEVVRQFKNLNVSGNDQDLKDAVTALNAGGATAADYGMRKAELLLNDLIANDPDRQSNKTVVLFTDGAPTYERNFDTNVANNTIAKAKDIKAITAYMDGSTEVKTSVFTVGVFDSETSQISTYMNYTSSNYPTAEAMNDDGDGGSDQGYYQNASGGDLSSIFRSIAAASGGSGATTVTAQAATTVDIVSQSFQLPEGSSADDISVYFANCSGKDSNGYLTFDEENKIPNPEDEEDPMHVSITVTGNVITASNFDYSGHWCGVDESVEEGYHGMKLMIEIPIEMSDDAVGGIGVGTNGPGSGIWIEGQDEPLIDFDTPHINLPTNLHIKKEGIATGECATFEIFRKALNASDWETTVYKTVIVIGGNNDNTVKLMGLDPNYLYKIKEKTSWSWSYDFDKVTDSEGNLISTTNEATSDQLIVNPFIFVNQKPQSTDPRVSIRHAESAVYNDFRTTGHVEGIDSGSKKKLDPEPEPEPTTPAEGEGK